MYDIVLSDYVIKKLAKIDKQIAKMILSWIDKNLVNNSNLKQLGKLLKGNYKDVWRFRIGSYRLLCEIIDDQLIVTDIDFGHRKNV